MQVSTFFKIAQSLDSEDSILEYKGKGTLKKVRVVKVEISNGIIETLVTNIYDDTVKIAEFKELYFLKWKVESKYKELKCSIEIEEFSGTKTTSIANTTNPFLSFIIIVSTKI